MCPKDDDIMANSVDPVQTASPLGLLCLPMDRLSENMMIEIFLQIDSIMVHNSTLAVNL